MGRLIKHIDGHYHFTGNGCTLEEVLRKLAHYEGLEEANRLIELPCAVGDEVYIPNERFPAEIEEIRITPRGVFAEYVQYDRGYEETEVWDEGSFWIEDVGKRVFLTKEEAEAKLKELEGEHIADVRKMVEGDKE